MIPHRVDGNAGLDRAVSELVEQMADIVISTGSSVDQSALVQWIGASLGLTVAAKNRLASHAIAGWSNNAVLTA